MLQALTSNAKLCYLILVRHQLDKPTSAGLAVREWCGSTGKAPPLVGGARSQLLRLLRARLVALGASVLSGGKGGPLTAQPLLGARFPAF